MSKKITFITLGILALIIPVGFTLASTKTQTSTTVERQEFDFAVSSQKQIDNGQDERISKLESSESSTVDFTDLGKEAIDSLPKSSTPSVNNSMSKKQAISTPTVTQPVTEPVVETPKKYAYKTILLNGAGTQSLNKKENFYDIAVERCKLVKGKCEAIINEKRDDGWVVSFYIICEIESDIKELFGHPIAYSKIEIN